MRLKTAAIAVSGALVVSSLAACSGSSSSSPTSSAVPIPSAVTPSDQIVLNNIQPNDGITPVVKFIKTATKSIDISIYEMDPNYKPLVNPLAAAVKKGISVRLSISRQLIGQPNPPEGNAVQIQKMQQFHVLGINAQLSRPEFHYAHEKAIILDAGTPQARVMVGDWNLQASYFGPGPYGPVGARGFAVLDTNTDDAAEIEANFVADFPPYQPWPASTRGSLVWSPSGPDFQPPGDSITALTGFVNGAQKTLDAYVAFTNVPSIMMNAVIARAKAGVKVRLVGNSSAFSSAEQLQQIKAAGIQVVFDPPGPKPGQTATMFVHGKTMVADAGLATEKAFVGSQNLFIDESLQSILELGTLVTNNPSIATLEATFDRDFAVSSPNQAPQPSPSAATSKPAGG